MLLRLVLSVLILLAPTAAWANPARVESDNFIFYGDNSRDRLKSFAEKVEKFDAVLRLLTGLQSTGPQPNKLTIFVVPGQDSVSKQAGLQSRNVAGVYIPNLTGSIAIVPRTIGSGDEYSLDAETVLFHEYVHHFMLQYFPAAYSPWYVEGFAEYLATTEFKKDGAIHVGLPARFRYYNLVVGTPFPVKRLLGGDLGKMGEEDTSKFYAWSWLLTHYLNLSPDRTGQLKVYLAAFAEGKPPEVAATTAFGDLAKLQADLVRYRDARKISYMQLKSLTLPTPKITITPLDQGEAALLPLMVRFSRGSRGKEEATIFATDARIAAARWVGHPRALELLAEGELDVEQFDAAAKANDALLALQPTNSRALLRKARIASARLKGGGDEAAWKAIRILVARANRANPDDPFPLVEYYRTFTALGREPPQMAFDGLVRAQELAPQDGQLRFMLARHLLNKKNDKAAANMLAPLLNDPHSAGVRAAARAMLDGSIALPEVDLSPDDKPAPPK